MKSFTHFNARSMEEALQLLSDHDGKARLIAGGTDLLGVLKDRILPDYPEALINMKTIPGIDSIKESEEGVEIGALTRLSDIIRSPAVARNWPILVQTALNIASPQVRNMASIGGNLCQDNRCWYYRYPDEIGGRILCFRKRGKTCPAVVGKNQYHAIMNAGKCHAVCPSDMAVSLAALEATLLIEGPAGKRKVAMEDFYAPIGNNLSSDEILTAIHIPRPSPDAGLVFFKFSLRRPIDFAIVSASIFLRLDQEVCKEARIVLGAVAYGPFRAVEAEKFLAGKTINRATTSQAAEIALAKAKPMSQNAYKVDVAKSLVKRAITSFKSNDIAE